MELEGLSFFLLYVTPGLGADLYKCTGTESEQRNDIAKKECDIERQGSLPFQGDKFSPKARGDTLRQAITTWNRMGLQQMTKIN